MTVSDTVTGMVPGSVKERINPLYLRYRGLRANRRHQPVATVSNRTAAAPHVLLVVIDALRLDATPDLPFAWAPTVAPSTWTFPSITSMHTGRYPHEHGAIAHTRADDATYAMPTQATGPVIPHAFERRGFETYAGMGFLTPFLAVQDWYQHHRVFPDVRAERVLDAYEQWREGRERTFAYLHLGDLHAPLNPPTSYVEAAGVDTSLPNLPRLAEYTDDFEDTEACRYYKSQRLALYHAAASYLEDVLAGPLPALADETIIMVTGDHGEAHWEHVDVDRRMTDSRPNYGVGPGGTPLDAVARVPAAVSTPTGDVKISKGTPSLRDVPRTLLELTFDEGVCDVPGHSWRDPIPAANVAVCEAPRYGVERKAAYRGSEKVIESRADGVALGAFVEEFTPGDQFGSLDRARVEELCEVFEWAETGEQVETGQYVREQLEALGYT